PLVRARVHAQRAVRGAGDHRVGERVAVDVRGRGRATQGRVFVRGAAAAGGDWCIVHGRDGEVHRRDVRVDRAVVGLEGEAVRAVVVGNGRVRISTGCSEEGGAGRGGGDQDREGVGEGTV